jgi:hypothetical protein
MDGWMDGLMLMLGVVLPIDSCPASLFGSSWQACFSDGRQACTGAQSQCMGTLVRSIVIMGSRLHYILG